jgi:hypothetical protein
MIKVPQQGLHKMPGVLGLAVCIIMGLVAHAQQAPDAMPQIDSNQLLLQRINELEVEVKQLQQKQASDVVAPEAAV